MHFDTLFDLQSAGGLRSSFSTAPECPPTHWKQVQGRTLPSVAPCCPDDVLPSLLAYLQVALYLEPPRELQAGDRMSGSISCARRADNKRAYDVSISFAINDTACGTQLWRVC